MSREKQFSSVFFQDRQPNKTSNKSRQTSTLKDGKKIRYGAILMQDFDWFLCIFFVCSPKTVQHFFWKQKIHDGAVLIQDFDFLVCVCVQPSWLSAGNCWTSA